MRTIKGRDLDTDEAKALSQLEDTFKKLQEMYRDAFMDANETYSDVGNLDDGAIKTSSRSVDSKRKSYYNEYQTNAMQWAYSASTEVGDTKILSVNGNSFALLEATEDGYVEIARGNYKEVLSHYEEMQRRADNSFYGYTQKIRTDKSGNMRLEFSRKGVGGDAAENSRHTGSERFQADTAGNDERVHTGDKGESEKQQISFSLRDNTNNTQKNTTDEGDVKLSDRANNYYQEYLDDMPIDEYNKLTVKKPIKVSKDVFAAVNSARTQLYGDAIAEDIPIIDIINLGEYGVLNSDDFYFIRNADRIDFSIIKHTKTLKGRKENYEEYGDGIRPEGKGTSRLADNSNAEERFEGEDNPSNRNNRPSSDKSAFGENANETQFVEETDRRIGTGNSTRDIGRRIIPSDRDAEYLELAKEPAENDSALRKMVENAAKKSGYTERVYHGTSSFGFVKLDVSHSDDKTSFFATDSAETARTYSKGTGVRKVGPLTDADVSRIKDEVYQKAKDYAAFCNSKLSNKAETILDSINEKIEESIIALKNGKSFSEVRKDFVEFLGLLDEKFLEDYYHNNYEEKLSSEEFFALPETEKLDDDISKRSRHIIKALTALDPSNKTGLYEMFANTSNMLEVECNGANWDNIPKNAVPRVNSLKHLLYANRRTWTTRSLTGYAKSLGYSGVIFKNLIDSGNGTNVAPSTVYAFFNPQEQVKSADPVTYDDNGNVIPLSQRFDKKNDDIRYSDREIIGESGTNYGRGVYLDSNKLDSLSEEERISEVKKHIESLGGVPFSAFDNKGNEVKIKIAPKTKYINENGKPARANRHLTNFLDNQVKQESLMLSYNVYY